MNDITCLKDLLSKAYAKTCEHCPSLSINDCEKGRACSCILAAEMRAYIQTILPKGFQDFDIFNFDGTKGGEQLLNRKQVRNIKGDICRYCWGVDFKKLKAKQVKDPIAVDRLSIMDRRRRRGDNVVIYGSLGRQIGRTLVASVIMKEAIKRRFRSESNVVQTYDWIEYTNLTSIARNPENLNDYQYCDWLVVDNFKADELHNSPAAKRYISSVIDPFFTIRFEEGLPTILVFRFDISEREMDVAGADMVSMFGLGVEKIINDDYTTKICLSEGEDG